MLELDIEDDEDEDMEVLVDRTGMRVHTGGGQAVMVQVGLSSSMSPRRGVAARAAEAGMASTQVQQATQPPNKQKKQKNKKKKKKQKKSTTKKPPVVHGTDEVEGKYQEQAPREPTQSSGMDADDDGSEDYSEESDDDNDEEEEEEEEGGEEWGAGMHLQDSVYTHLPSSAHKDCVMILITFAKLKVCLRNNLCVCVGVGCVHVIMMYTC